jgi:CheY-like chemotaxis protein
MPSLLSLPRHEPSFVGVSGAVLNRAAVFRVSVSGLSETLQRVLEIVLQHTRNNPYRYVVQPDSIEAGVDLVLIEVTGPQGARQAAALRARMGEDAVLTVGRRSGRARRPDDVLVQRFAVAILEALNTLATRCLNRRAQRQREGVQPGHEWGRRHALEALLGRPPRALVLEPLLREQQRVAHALLALGLAPTVAGSAREALAALSTQAFEVVWVAARLADRSGFAMIRELKRHARYAPMPMIVHNRVPRPWDMVRAAWSGCDSYLVKPVSVTALQNAVERCLQRVPAQPIQAWVVA